MKNGTKIFLTFAAVVVAGLFYADHVFAGREEGVDINRFDVQPRTVNVGQSLNFTLNVTVYKTEFDRYCTILPGGGLVGSDLYWTVGEILPDGRNLNFHPGTGNNIVTYNQLRQRFDNNGVARIDFSFPKAAVSRQRGDASTPNIPDRKFYAEFSCNRATGAVEITRSNQIPVTVNAGSGCGGPGQPSCSSCGGPGQPSCGSTCGGPGQPACTGGGICNNNNVCEPNLGETSATCTDCPIRPGETVPFIFKLDNPLQANNLLELIDVLATWLFNLSIPIVVIMIVWAGVMFLTSRGDTTKVTKARQILLYAVVGFAIILIGKGFITLIESVLNLGTGSSQQQQQSGGNQLIFPITGGIACRSGTDCPQGFSCDNTSEGRQVINGQTFGTCFASSRGAIGSSCSRDRDCFSGLECNDDGRICQRPGGNLQGEPCAGGGTCAENRGCDASGENVQVIGGRNLGTCR